MGSVSSVERPGAISATLIDDSVVNVVRGEVTDAAVAVLVVVPVEERAAEAAGVLDRADEGGEIGSVLQGFELRLGERIVVGDVENSLTPTIALRVAK